MDHQSIFTSCDRNVRIHHRESFGQAVADLPNVSSEVGKYKQPGIYPGICPDHFCVARLYAHTGMRDELWTNVGTHEDPVERNQNWYSVAWGRHQRQEQ